MDSNLQGAKSRDGGAMTPEEEEYRYHLDNCSAFCFCPICENEKRKLEKERYESRNQV